jgi:AcrR family transcriptional regulator
MRSRSGQTELNTNSKNLSTKSKQVVSRRVQSNRTQKSSERRRQIFVAALQCFERDGYHKATINDIADAAGVSSGLIYKYFSDKRDVLFEVILEILEAYNRDVPRAVVGKKHPLLRLQAAAIAYFEVISRHHNATLMAYRETKSLNRDQIEILKLKEIQTNELIKRCIQECMEAGYCNDISLDLTVYSLLSSAHMWALKNWRLREICTHREYVVESISMILNYILNDTGKKVWQENNLLD